MQDLAERTCWYQLGKVLVAPELADWPLEGLQWDEPNLDRPDGSYTIAKDFWSALIEMHVDNRMILVGPT